MIFEPDEKDDWTSDEAIIKANPNLDISVSLDFIKSRIKEAMDKPSKQVDVKTKNLNIWTHTSVGRAGATVWIPKEVWDLCYSEIDIKSLNGEKCFTRLCTCGIGVDLATTRDIAAYSLCFIQDDKYIILPRFFMPAHNIRERSKDDRVPYELWAQEGFITLCDGENINFDIIESSILADGEKYEVLDISYDPWKAIEIVTHLTHGCPLGER